MYECAICLTLNHNARLHCQCCGTIPARYSITGYDMRSNHTSSDTGISLVQTIVARGADRVEQHHATRAKLQTMPLDYYAEA